MVVAIDRQLKKKTKYLIEYSEWVLILSFHSWVLLTIPTSPDCFDVSFYPAKIITAHSFFRLRQAFLVLSGSQAIGKLYMSSTSRDKLNGLISTYFSISKASMSSIIPKMWRIAQAHKTRVEARWIDWMVFLMSNCLLIDLPFWLIYGLCATMISSGLHRHIRFLFFTYRTHTHTHTHRKLSCSVHIHFSFCLRPLVHSIYTHYIHFLFCFFLPSLLLFYFLSVWTDYIILTSPWKRATFPLLFFSLPSDLHLLLSFLTYLADRSIDLTPWSTFNLVLRRLNSTAYVRPSLYHSVPWWAPQTALNPSAILAMSTWAAISSSSQVILFIWNRQHTRRPYQNDWHGVIATIIIDVVAIIMTAIMIYHIRSKYTAVGKNTYTYTCADANHVQYTNWLIVCLLSFRLRLLFR